MDEPTVRIILRDGSIELKCRWIAKIPFIRQRLSDNGNDHTIPIIGEEHMCTRHLLAVSTWLEHYDHVPLIFQDPEHSANKHIRESEISYFHSVRSRMLQNMYVGAISFRMTYLRGKISSYADAINKGHIVRREYWPFAHMNMKIGPIQAARRDLGFEPFREQPTDSEYMRLLKDSNRPMSSPDEEQPQEPPRSTKYRYKDKNMRRALRRFGMSEELHEVKMRQALRHFRKRQALRYSWMRLNLRRLSKRALQRSPSADSEGPSIQDLAPSNRRSSDFEEFRGRIRRNNGNVDFLRYMRKPGN